MVGEIKKVISTVLPRYMISTADAYMKELPRNPNGKIDRLQLKEMQQG